MWVKALKFSSILAALLIFGSWTHGLFVPFSGICDLITCAEAYDVTRSSSINYSGPLFQLYNGSTTLDIGQTANHQVDMSTWSAFCSSVASNCKYAKIYAHVHTGGANDLIPSIFSAPFGPDCSGGGAFKCATPFAIEAATGLPAFISGTPQGYTLSGDANATGVNGPGSDSTIVYNGRSVNLAGGMCCGPFGIGHAYNAPDVNGTDFFISIAFGQFANPAGNQCQTAATYCIGIDEESEGDWADYGSSIINLVGVVTYAAGTNKVTASVNGTILINKTPTATFSNNGNTIHLAAGGDLSNPAPAYMREIIVANSPISGASQTAITANVRAYYPALTFP